MPKNNKVNKNILVYDGLPNSPIMYFFIYLIGLMPLHFLAEGPSNGDQHHRDCKV